LYKHSHTGTKNKIAEYIAEVELCFASLLQPSPPESTPSAFTHKTYLEVLESLTKTRQAFGRTALLLSGGATFGMNHIGVLKSLWEARLLPRIMSGSSAGAIVASACCVKTDRELPKLLEEFPYGNLDVFEDSTKPESILSRTARFLKHGTCQVIV
jgi:TAG lipase/steryl ester hydrolase/phospholipase A2/LPA acyltransferase